MFALLIAACESPSDTKSISDPEIRLSMQAGPDTIGAFVTIRIEVLDSTASLARNQRIIVTGDLLYTSDPNGYRSRVDTLTDQQGRFTYVGLLPEETGTAVLRVAAPSLLASDSLLLDVRPGAVHRVALHPKDTAVTIGGSVPFRTTTYDRAGNQRTDNVQLSTASAKVTLAGLMANSVSTGRAVIRAAVSGASAITDSATVYVAPPLTFALTDLTNRLLVRTLDGPANVVTQAEALASSWSPDGRSMAFTRNTRLNVVDVASGEVRTLPTTGSFIGHLEWTRDGWIYFSDVLPDTRGAIFRIRPDGTDLEQIQIEQLGPFASVTGPAISPDGKRLAYSTSTQILVYNFETRTNSILTWFGNAPRWSPDGAWIAFTSEGGLHIMDPAGTTRHVIDTGGVPVFEGISWSTDSRWIAAALGTYEIVLVDAVTHEMLKLGLPGTYPAVRPAN